MNENPYKNNNQPAARIATLIAGYIRKTLTTAEHDELDDWVNESDANMQLFEELTDEDNLAAQLKWFKEIDTDEAYKKMQETAGLNASPKRSFKWSLIAAAVAFIIVGTFALLYFRDSPARHTTGTAANSMNLSPDANSVLLELANGEVVNLSQTGATDVNWEADLRVQQPTDSTLAYLPQGSNALQTLSTPAGKQFQVKLADGTRVWLNAGSRLVYPGNFTGNERRVTLIGEAYFEVAPDADRPFKVSMEDSTLVTVLGTHFNIAAYSRASKAVTLLEGKVQVSSSASLGKAITLKPGTQTTISKGIIQAPHAVDTDMVMAWKQGLFIFKDASLVQMMNQLEKWYGLTVVYEGNTRQLFNARFSRTEILENVLKTLELNGHLSFKLKNNTLYVLPR